MSSLFSRFELASFKRYLNNAKQVSKRSNKFLISVLYDMGICILNEHFGYMEYNLFHFEYKSKQERATYVNLDYSNFLVNLLNDKAYIPLFDSKLDFNRIFKDYLGREFLDVENASFNKFKEYCKGKSAIFCKPNDSCSGKGFYRSFLINSKTDLKALYDLFRKHHVFVEDTINQHPKMKLLNPSSINTIRICTLLDNKGIVHVMYALQRIGTENRTVDNVGSGGIYTVLSNDGVIVNPCWSDKTIKTYTNHPTTGYPLIDFKIPYFKEAVDLCKRAAKVEPHVRYVGWDIAISTNGPVIVEGNAIPGYDMAQNYFASGKDVGLKPEFEKILMQEINHND